jgi:hypothetical protein
MSAAGHMLHTEPAAGRSIRTGWYIIVSASPADLSIGDFSDDPEQTADFGIDSARLNFAGLQSLDVPDLSVDLVICRRFYGAESLSMAQNRCTGLDSAAGFP